MGFPAMGCKTLGSADRMRFPCPAANMTIFIDNNYMSLFRHILTTKLIFVFLLTTTLLGCSTVRFAYNQGDTLTYWWLDDHIGFNQTQESFIRGSLERHFWWHRTEQLPGISGSLQRAQQKLQAPVSKTEFLILRAELLKHVYRIADEVIPDTAKLLTSLDASQIETIQKRFDKNNQKFKNEFLPKDKIKQGVVRANKIIERTEWLYGNLSSTQENKIREFLAKNPIDNEIIFQERLRRQSEFMAICKEVQQQKLNQKATESLLRDYMKYFEAGKTKEQQSFHKKWIEAGAETASFISHVVNEEQNKYATERVGGWLADVQELIKDSSVLAAKRSAHLSR
jgi:Family of unknown function (DUF6279)